MASKPSRRLRVASLFPGFVALALGFATAEAQPAPRETPTEALSRYIRVLAQSPKDFQALIGAGKAALAIGDSQAAGGFFARAEEVYPSSSLPQAGLGAAMTSDGDAQGALPYFARAQQLGATATMIGSDRGLAYDLLGRHADAQKDYRAALGGTDADEARRRLAMSLAITGDKAGAFAMLAPLLSRGDPGAARCRALVLALTGDLQGARRWLDSAMPGSSASMAPFLAKLPSLRSDQKAAAVNLGIFPGTGQPSYAYVPPAVTAPAAPSRSTFEVASARPRGKARRGRTVAGAIPMSGDRLASIDELLRAPVTPPPPPVQVATITPLPPPPQASALAANRSRIWVQLASGSNPAALPEQFRRIRSKNSEMFEGMSGYVAQEPDRARLLIGPFKSVSDANIIVDDLESVRIDAFSWTSPAGQTIRKLATE